MGSEYFWICIHIFVQLRESPLLYVIMNMAELLWAKSLFKKAISEKNNILTPPRSTRARLTQWGQNISGISFYISCTYSQKAIKFDEISKFDLKFLNPLKPDPWTTCSRVHRVIRFWAYAGQPHNHIGWAMSMPFASINPTNSRTNP